MTNRRVPREVPKGIPVTQKEWERLCMKSRLILIDVVEELTELQAEAAAELDGDVEPGRETSDSEVEVGRAERQLGSEDG